MSDDEHSYDEAMMEDEETALEIAALQSENLLPQPKKEFINHKAALRALVDEISQKSLKWIQRCDVTSSEPIVVDKTENDLDRELKFYQQGLEAVVRAQLEVQKAGMPFSRPDDYFAEMVKTDAHMARIRQKLLDQQKGIQNSEEAKKQRELRKYGKKIEQEKLKEREDQKKASLDKIATIKKRLRSGDLGEVDDFEIDVDSDGDGGKAKGARGKKGRDGKPTANKKRQLKDEKFGFGGKKRGLRKNTADSTSDMSGFSQKRNKSANFSAVHKRGKTKRPGKAKRQRTN
ncbi:RRNA processing protein [Coemansia thaxteri]|uniref:rRNA processing protein n=1 Tax=Coemansia thaxteri TaxID=2663907 RepID=A0A9W8BJC3_9FUNG|nr:RRNA processing protein [Coemansia thaxteri]KAJ2007168.1 RRNA processing protein [Coemansia thaxteri]KAJ2465263.1 RRNA processing protein [Coemansia sp. RSA 2322]KAJ2486827.1 RRNA processing protein [Coemansia sp. RSA 2320]